MLKANTLMIITLVLLSSASAIKKMKVTQVGGNCVQFFQHINYEGWSRTYCEDNSWIGNSDNDQFSSVKVGGNINAVMFEHRDFKGKQHYINGDIPNFVTIGWNDIVSSLIVVRKGCVNLYQHCDFAGYRDTYCGGNNWVGNAKNDQYSAFVTGDNSYDLFEHINFGGRVLLAKAETANNCLVQSGFNDIISSVRSANQVPDNCVRFYQHINFEGYTREYCNDNSWIGNTDNDQFSSVKLGANVNAVLFEHRDFKGKRQYISKEVSNFVPNGWNDIVSSVIVVDKNCVNLYEHCDFAGWRVSYCDTNNWVGNDKNDRISSYVTGNFRWTLFEHINLGGRTLEAGVRSSDECIVNEGFNDLVSSVRKN